MLPRATGILLLVLTATGCASLIPSFYTVPVRQGNYIDQATVGQLRPGMTKQQVQRLLGTPLIADPFHQEPLGLLLPVRQGRQHRRTASRRPVLQRRHARPHRRSSPTKN
jgi:hypothetical protein